MLSLYYKIKYYVLYPRISVGKDEIKIWKRGRVTNMKMEQCELYHTYTQSFNIRNRKCERPQKHTHTFHRFTKHTHTNTQKIRIWHDCRNWAIKLTFSEAVFPQGCGSLTMSGSWVKRIMGATLNFKCPKSNPVRPINAKQRKCYG